MIHATAKINIPSKMRSEALAILNSMSNKARYEPGCISHRVYQDIESEDVIMVDELWNDKEDLERHLQSDEYYRVLLVLDMASVPPEIRFDQISRSTGFETIEKARTQSNSKEAL